jgi:hypothetical protein
MKYLTQILFIGILAIALSTTAQAQTSIDSNAEILSAISYTNNATLEFGALESGSSVDVDPSGGNATGTQIGSITVEGSSGQVVSLSFTTLSDLSADTETGTLTYNTDTGTLGFDAALYEGGGTSTGESATASWDPTGGTSQTAELDSDGIIVKIGGQVDSDGSEPADTYTGTVTLNATYN